MSKKYLYVCCTLLFLLLTACSKTEEPAPPPETAPAPAPAPAAGVTAGAIEVGKAVGPDKKVTTPVQAFAKGDTFYVSVDTTGAGTATLKAKWTYHKGGQVTVVSESEPLKIMPAGPETSEFHVSKPGGWPAGEYQVEVFLDDKSVGVRNFTVA